jgi:signal transduction histidine kinase
MHTEHDAVVRSFGELVASFTHEMKNILAIIQESGGLLQDLIHLKLGEEFAYKDKFSRSLSVIEQQVDRGQDLSSRLNLLAHTPDHWLTCIDVCEYLEMMVLLSHKIATRNAVTIRTECPDQRIELRTSPAIFVSLVFQCLKHLLQSLPPQSEIVVQASQKEKQCMIQLRDSNEKRGDKGSSEDLEQAVTTDAHLEQLAQTIQGQVEIATTWICLLLPQYPEQGEYGLD